MPSTTASPQPDYYKILGLDSIRHQTTFTPQFLKTAYKRALLAHHPDKQSSQSVNHSAPSIDTVALAYKILSTPSLKAQYDLPLTQPTHTGSAAGKVFHTGLETVDLDDLAFDEANGIWTRDCRCGDDKGFQVTDAELEKNVNDGELITGCRGCSLWLRVLFGVSEG